MIRLGFTLGFGALLVVTSLGMNAAATSDYTSVCRLETGICGAGSGDGLLQLAQGNEQPHECGYWQEHKRCVEADRPGPPRRQRKYIEQLRLLKLLELLDLREDQELDFITAFHAMRRERRLLRERRTAVVDELADGLVAKNVSDDTIARLIQEISVLAKQEGQVMDEFLTEARRILTPRQLGRFIVFQERFELELLERVRAFRERRQRPFRPEEPGGPSKPDREEKHSLEQPRNF